MLPVFIDPLIDLQNREIITNRLNEPDAFDLDLDPNEKDILELCFTIKGPQSLSYYFIF